MRKLITLLLCCSILLCGCSVARHSNTIKNASLDKYKYFYVMGTTPISSSSGAVYGSNGVVFGSSKNKSVNPEDVISGYLMKLGMVRLPSVQDNLAGKTLLVAYGESGRHSEFLGHSLEITLQFLDGASNEVVATSTAAGMGETETDDIRKALLRALNNVFGKK
ncbi:MAG: hypothetical protein E7108_05990 [Bacteroidales bacterium]|jgi:hypothetical protein|nr:hypothetical protein [Bacteroidales bacterium]